MSSLLVTEGSSTQCPVCSKFRHVIKAIHEYSSYTKTLRRENFSVAVWICVDADAFGECSFRLRSEHDRHLFSLYTDRSLDGLELPKVSLAYLTYAFS